MKSDLCDILDVTNAVNDDAGKEESIRSKKREKRIRMKRPSGMSREVWGLIFKTDKEFTPLMPAVSGYQSLKAQLGQNKVRRWVWTSFKNSARKDSAEFFHWKREKDEEIAYGKIPKEFETPQYNEVEYLIHLNHPHWTSEETRHLMNLCQQFSLRFDLVKDRWDDRLFRSRSIEDLKDRYYEVAAIMAKVHKIPYTETKYDAEHERKRKKQLEKLFSRTAAQVEEEEILNEELKRIETRRKDQNRRAKEIRRQVSTTASNKQGESLLNKDVCEPKHYGAFDVPRKMRKAGVTLASKLIKSCETIGVKKLAAINMVLNECNVATPSKLQTYTVSQFETLADLYFQISKLFDLKISIIESENQLQSLIHQSETTCPGSSRAFVLPERIAVGKNFASKFDVGMQICRFNAGGTEKRKRCSRNDSTTNKKLKTK